MKYLQPGQYLIKISLRNLLPWRRGSEFKRRLRVWGKEFSGLQVGFYEPVFKFISQIKHKLQVVMILKQFHQKDVTQTAAAFELPIASGRSIDLNKGIFNSDGATIRCNDKRPLYDIFSLNEGDPAARSHFPAYLLSSGNKFLRRLLLYISDIKDRFQDHASFNLLLSILNTGRLQIPKCFCYAPSLDFKNYRFHRCFF
jgi:hypothetical protein